MATDVLQQLKAALRANGREEDVENATILTAAATLRAPGGMFLPPAAANAFKSAWCYLCFV
jgi:hypothetical protein